MKVELHIVAGSLKRRKLVCNQGPDLRPTPQMVREALFSILGNAVPDQPFFDVFAGTGINGLEAISRGAKSATFIEKEFRLGQDIDRHLQEFKVADVGRVLRGDCYRWADQWRAPAEPVNVFISPPFGDYTSRPAELARLVEQIQTKAAAWSVIVLQMEKGIPLDELPHPEEWERRGYGRNILMIWQKPDPNADSAEGSPPTP